MARVVVRVEPVPGPAARVRFRARCEACEWVSPIQSVRVAADELARYHRYEHQRRAS